jgi:hypothetical protein
VKVVRLRYGQISKFYVLKMLIARLIIDEGFRSASVASREKKHAEVRSME